MSKVENEETFRQLDVGGASRDEPLTPGSISRSLNVELNLTLGIETRCYC